MLLLDDDRRITTFCVLRSNGWEGEGRGVIRKGCQSDSICHCHCHEQQFVVNNERRLWQEGSSFFAMSKSPDGFCIREKTLCQQ